MSDLPRVIALPAMPDDMIFAVMEGKVVGGLRLDIGEPGGAVTYTPEEARGMADLLGITDKLREVADG